MKSLLTGSRIWLGAGLLVCWRLWAYSSAIVPKSGDLNTSGTIAVVGFTMMVIGTICIMVAIGECAGSNNNGG